MGTTLYPVWVAQWGRRVPKPGMHRKPPHRISRLDLDRRIAGGQGDMGTEGDSMGRTSSYEYCATVPQIQSNYSTRTVLTILPP